MEAVTTKSVSNRTLERRITKTSLALWFLIKICFIPVSVKNNKIVFKIFSFKVLFYILCAMLFNMLLQRLVILFMKQEDIDRFLLEVIFSIIW